MSTTVAAREWQGIEIPAAGTWELDRSHTTVGFVARHLMVSKVHGRFGVFSGTLHVDEQPERSYAAVSIDTASIDSNDPRRDEHLRSPDFLDVATYPEMRFRSTGLRPTSGTTFALDGELTIRDVTKPVTLQVQYEGLVPDPWGGHRAGFSARTEIDREDFGLTWNMVLEAGGVAVGRTVKIVIEVEAVRAV